METVNIIIADDEEIIHESLIDTLESIHFDFKIVKECYDAMSVLRYLYTIENNKEQPDVLILDHHFGGSSISGLELLPYVRKVCPLLPILMLTTFSVEDADFIKAREEYYIDYIQKPVKSSDLYFRINDIIKRKKEWDALQRQIIETRRWAFKSIALANNNLADENIDFSNTEEWEIYQQKVLEIANSIKDFDMKQQGNNSGNFNFDVVRKRIAKTFDKLNPKEVETLATGEYLYNVHEHDNIDFSPVLISYSKGLELTLKQFLLSIGYPTSVNKEMLNNLVVKIQQNLDKIGGNKDIITMIRKFQNKRNKAAHVSGINRHVIQEIRGLLIDFENPESNCILNVLNYYMPS